MSTFVPGGGGGTEFNEGDPYVANSPGGLGMVVRRDADTILPGVVNNDVTPLLTDDKGRLKVVDPDKATPFGKIDSPDLGGVHSEVLVSSIIGGIAGTNIVASTAGVVRRIKWSFYANGVTPSAVNTMISLHSGGGNCTLANLVASFPLHVASIVSSGTFFASCEFSGEVECFIPSGTQIKARQFTGGGGGTWNVILQFLG